MSEELGKKFDAGKTKIGMVVKYFADALMEVAKCGTYGCAKYGNGKFWDYNWNRVENAKERYSDAMMRHFLLEETEVVDSDTELLHASHVAWNALAKLQIVLDKNRRAREEKDALLGAAINVG